MNLLIEFANRNRGIIKRIVPPSLIRAASSIMQRGASVEKCRGGFEKGAWPSGVNVIGYLRSRIGVGQGARLLSEAVMAAGIPLGLVDLPLDGSPDKEVFHPDLMMSGPRYSVNVVHVNPRDFYLHVSPLPSSFWRRRYNIGVWLWELEEFPDMWLKYFDFVDEVWTPSSFNTEAIAKKSPVPVRTVPYGVTAVFDEGLGRAHFGLPEDRFLFLSMFDANSGRERKNPDGAVRAFRTAFPSENGDVALVVKANNASLSELGSLVGDRRDVIVISRSMSKTEVNSLVRSCDCFVSLHRSEGFGLVMAEAMKLGVPCIATGWSANMDFMNESNSRLVGYRLVDVKDDEIYLPVYEGRFTPRWADPDIGQAAAFMRELSESPSACGELAERARRDIESGFSTEASAARIREALEPLL